MQRSTWPVGDRNDPFVQAHGPLVLLAALAWGCASTDGLAGGRSGGAESGTSTSATSPEPDNGGGSAASSETAPSPSSSNAACTEAGASRFGGHCYFVLAAGSQASSQAACASRGAHLVTITSAAEQDHVARLSTASTWIGLTSPSATNDAASYRWLTGEARVVDFWHPGQPNDGHGCVVAHYTDRLWRDVTCTNTYPALCERD
jgi:hypothetical protein